MVRPMNTRNESTSTTLEDSPATAQPDAPNPQGQQPEDKAPQEAPPAVDKPATEQATPPPKAETPFDDKGKPTAAPAEDPVKAAIARLANDTPEAKAPEKTPAKPDAKAQPDKPGEAKPTSGAPAETKPEDHAQGDLPPDAVDPLSTWTEQERKHTKGTVKAKFRDLHTQVESLRDDAETGKAWTTVLQAENLTPDVEILDDKQIAWSLKSQAAAIRAVTAVQQGRNPSQTDLDLLDRLRTGIAEVDKAIGRRPAADPTAVLEAFDGPIPHDLREQGELAGLNEQEIRLVAALRAPKAKPAARQPAAAPAAPAAQTQAPQPTATRQPEQQQGRPAPSVESFYARRSNEAIAKIVGDPTKVAAFFDQTVAPILANQLRADYPGKNPEAVFQNLGPAERHQLVVEALTAHQQRSPVSTTPPPTQSRTPMRSGGGSASPGAPVDPVKAAISRLATDG